MEIRILGPLDVRDGQRVVGLGGGKQRALLADLAIHRGQPLPPDRLIDDLWGERPPPSAPKTLQVLISRLRKVLGRDAIVMRGGGYVLADDGISTDLEELEPLLRDARNAGAAGNQQLAAETAAAALALFRGRPLADFTYDDFAQTEIARLEELQLSALEEHLDHELALGRRAESIPKLEALARAHPLRERFRAQLMLALYRSGRQADALEVYQATRRHLAEEVGLEPGEPLKALQQAILAHDAVLDQSAHEALPGDLAVVMPPPQASPVRESRKTVTVVFADATPSGDGLDPELLRRVTGRWFQEMREVLERHGGTVDRLMVGGLTAVFGAPLVHEDDALRALRASAELRERLSTLNDGFERDCGIRLGLRVGVGTGEVVTGGQGEGQIVGDAVAAAARLQQSARSGEILIAPSTRRFVGDGAMLEAADGPREVAFRLVAIRDSPVPARFTSPMVGRERERRRLHDVYEQAVIDASCQLFTILGAAGVGKSRLVREFLSELGDAARVARGRCLPYGEGITYWPVVEAVKEIAELDDSLTPEQSREKLGEQLASADDAALIAQRVSELIGLDEVGGGVDEGSWAIRAFFEGVARRRPLVLVFDDIHWGEPRFLELVEQFADWSRDVPLLLVCVARPDLLDVRPNWGGGKLNATTVLLEPLSDAESAELIDHIAGGAADSALRRRVIAAAEGNPLFVEEMLALAREDGAERVELAVPPTIQALLAARLDRLEDDERLLLESAAVEGKVFHEGSVAALAPEALRSRLAPILGVLVRKELIRPTRGVFAGERGFRFRHQLIRDAAYEAISKGTRAELHTRHADWLEQMVGGRLAEYEEIVGYHLESAFCYHAELGAIDDSARELARRAATRLGAAGRRAFARSDLPAAVNLTSRAAALLPKGDAARLELIPNMRVVQGLEGDLTWAHGILDEALEAADATVRAHALVQRGFLQLFTDPAVAASELVATAQEAIAVFEPRHDHLGLARAWRLVAQAQYLARRGSACAEASERALVHAGSVRDFFETKEIIEWLSVSLALGSTPADVANRRCAELLRDIAGERVLEVTLLSVRGYLTAMEGNGSEARALHARARAAAPDSIELHRLPYYAIYGGFFELLLGDVRRARADLVEAANALKAVGERTNYSSVAALLALALSAEGRHAQAEEFSHASEAAARRNDVHANILWRSARARARSGLGDLAAAESLAHDAVAFAEPSDFLNAHGDALVVLAEILLGSGRQNDAASALRKAMSLYDQKGNVVSAAAARDLLRTFRV
jgi:DNA-binding SARP family transcriptional activator